MTMIELLVVLAIQVVILGSAAMLYVYTVTQSGHGLAAASSLQQADAALNDVAATIRQATSCSVVTSGTLRGLRCTLPANGIDQDGDGVLDVTLPSKYLADGSASYTNGRRIWYYLAGATGAFGTPGGILWRASRTDDSNPTSADVDAAWSKYYGGKSRFPLVSACTFTVSSSGQNTTVTLTASATEGNAESAAPGGTAAADLQTITLTRTVAWRTQYE